MDEKLTIYDKKTKEILNEWNDRETIYKSLYDCMSARYFFKASSVERIYQRNLCNGYRRIKVYCDNNTIWEFIVKEWKNI